MVEARLPRGEEPLTSLAVVSGFAWSCIRPENGNPYVHDVAQSSQRVHLRTRTGSASTLYEPCHEYTDVETMCRPRNERSINALGRTYKCTLGAVSCQGRTCLTMACLAEHST